MNLWRNFASCLAQMQSSKGPNTPKQEEAGKGKKKEKRKEERRKNKRPELWVTAVQIFFASKAEFFAEPPKSHNPPPLRLSHLPTGGRRRRHGGWRRGVRDRGADLREDHPRRGVRRPDRLLRPPDQPPRHSYPFQIPPHPVPPPPPPISVLCHFRSPCCSCVLRLFLFPWRGRSQEGVGRAERGERRNVRVLKANYIREFSVVGKADDPLDPAGCVLDLAAIHAREEAALRCVTLPSRPCSTIVCSLSDVFLRLKLE